MNKMNRKQLIGLVVFVFGIATITYAIHSIYKIKEAKEKVGWFSSLFHGSPEGELFGGILHAKASSYDVIVTWMLVCGIVLFLVGIAMFIYYRSRK